MSTSVERILAEYQQPAAGDLMPMFKELRSLAIAYTVTAFATSSVDGLGPSADTEAEEPDSTWTWRLTPMPHGGTQLVRA